eukprot:6367854-Amphidinium_carterae.1
MFLETSGRAGIDPRVPNNESPKHPARVPIVDSRVSYLWLPIQLFQAFNNEQHQDESSRKPF